MNKRILSPILVTIIATLSLLPAVSIPRVYAQPASLSVDPPLFIGEPGDTFTVNVNVFDVVDLVGYDVTVLYNPSVLTATAVDFNTNTVFCLDAVGVPHVPCRFSLLFAQVLDNDGGAIRSARSLTGGESMDVDGTTGPLPVLIITFEVLARSFSAIHIQRDDECACQSLAAFSGGQVVGVPHDSVDAQFLGVPNMVLVAGKNYPGKFVATASPRVLELAQGISTTTIKTTISLGASESLGGFAFAVFDLIDPHGNTFQLITDLAVLGPGDMAEVTAPFSVSTDCSVSCGKWSILVTLWRGPTETDIFPGMQAAGKFFVVNPGL